MQKFENMFCYSQCKNFFSDNDKKSLWKYIFKNEYLIYFNRCAIKKIKKRKNKKSVYNET